VADRFTYQAERGDSQQPVCAMLDAVQLGQSASLGIGATRVGSLIECTGMRRYRVKCVQLTGAGPTRVRAMDLPFAPASANAWTIAILAAAQATGVRSTYDFGEGVTAAAVLPLLNFMGPFLAIELQNNGGDAATYEIELWMQC
jgi:hypothetical protein